MSTALPISTAQTQSSRRVGILAAASALVVAASVSVTLAVSNGSDTSSPVSVGASPTAQPDRATVYHNGANVPVPAGSRNGQLSAERYHHFR